MTVNWEVEDAILDYKIPRLTLQPLIENSVLHGIQHLLEGGVVDIQIKSTNKNKIMVKIINPVGKKMFYSEDKHNNISLGNLKERLDIYYNADVLFKHRQKNNEYTVLLVFPIRK